VYKDGGTLLLLLQTRMCVSECAPGCAFMCVYVCVCMCASLRFMLLSKVRGTLRSAGKPTCVRNVSGDSRREKCVRNV